MVFYFLIQKNGTKRMKQKVGLELVNLLLEITGNFVSGLQSFVCPTVAQWGFQICRYQIFRALWRPCHRLEWPGLQKIWLCRIATAQAAPKPLGSPDLIPALLQKTAWP